MQELKERNTSLEAQVAELRAFSDKDDKIKECEGRVKALERENDKLQRELAHCMLCDAMCSKNGHAARIKEIKGDE